LSKKFTKSDVLRLYDGWASNFDQDSQRIFAKDGALLVERSDLARGMKVLDVATGRGAVLFPAASEVGERGFALGADLSGEMVRHALRDAIDLGFLNVSLAQMDAEHLAIAGGTFDRVLCGYGLFFLPHLQRGLSEFLRVLKPGGQFVTTTAGGSDGRWSWYWELLENHGALPNPASQSLDRAGELQEFLQNAGFIEVDEAEENDDLIYDSPETWWETREALLRIRLSEESVEPFRRAAFDKLESMREEDGIHRTSRVRITRGIKPG
jgi:O-methyltransferase/aklanonic acid methyltransferase